MSERDRAADKLLRAAEEFGDAALASQQAIYGWEGEGDRDALKATAERYMNAVHALRSTARAYATSTRARRRKAAPTQQEPEHG